MSNQSNKGEGKAQQIGGKLKEVVDKYDRGTPSPAKVEENMKAAGYAKNAAGLPPP